MFPNDREVVPERDWCGYTNSTKFLVEYQSGWLSFEEKSLNNPIPSVTPRTFLPLCYHEDGEVYNAGPRD